MRSANGVSRVLRLALCKTTMAEPQPSLWDSLSSFVSNSFSSSTVRLDDGGEDKSDDKEDASDDKEEASDDSEDAGGDAEEEEEVRPHRAVRFALLDRLCLFCGD